MGYLETALAIWRECEGQKGSVFTESEETLRSNELSPISPILPTCQTASWDDIAGLQWGPEFADPAWDRGKGLILACAFSGFDLDLDGDRLVVTETRGPMSDDDRNELARYQGALVPLVRAVLSSAESLTAACSQ